MINQMQSLGAVVTYYDVIVKGIVFWVLDHFQSLKDYKIGSYRKKLMKFIESNDEVYEYVFVLSGYHITENHLIVLRKNQENAMFILYLWDAICRIEGIRHILHFFDKIFSFDYGDVARNGFIFRPLFFRPEIKMQSLKKTFDVSFVGAGHSERGVILSNIRNNLLSNGYKVFFKVIMGRREILSLLFSHKLHLKDLSINCWTKEISYSKYCKILSMSKCVIDIHHPDQDGLTMRCIEAFAAGCFLITTNKNIKKHNDIPPSSYFILDRDGKNIGGVNFDNIINVNIDMSSYTLEAFIKDIFS
jgi:hypothetical protein